MSGRARLGSLLPFLWRGAALAFGIEVAARAGGFSAPLALVGGAWAVWLMVGYQTRRPLVVAGSVAAAVTLAGLGFWRLPAAFLLFVPIWAILWVVPDLLVRGFAARRPDSDTAVTPGLPDRWGGLEARFPHAAEIARVAAVLLLAGLSLSPFLHNGILGGEDAKWYTAVVADHLLQWRAGHGPAFVGQTPYAAYGTVFPLRVAPGLQHATLLLDTFTGRSLQPWFLLNLALFCSACLGGLSAYLCLRRLIPQYRTEALLLAVLYSWCPGVVGLAYTGQLFMSTMTWPFIPMVFVGIIRWCRGESEPDWWLAPVGCAGCFVGHSPIGLWCTAVTGAVVLFRLVFFGSRLLLRRALISALLFLGLCGYVFVSMYVLAPEESPPVHLASVTQTVAASWPQSLLPVSPEAGYLFDLQLDYSLWLVLVAAIVFGWRRWTASERALAFAVVGLALLVLPVPGVTSTLWKLVPQGVLNVTNAAPNQRLYTILAGATVALGAAALRSAELSPRTRWVFRLALILCVIWSAYELSKFLRRGRVLANTPHVSEVALRPENLALSRYSTTLLAQKNRFFSHGVVDFALEQRVLQPSNSRVVVSNVGFIAPGFTPGPKQAVRAPLPEVFRGTPEPNDAISVHLTPTLTLEPGKRYLLAFEFPDESLHGILVLKGEDFYREYMLPLSGEPFSFGAARWSGRTIPLSTSASRPISISLTFIQHDRGAPRDRYAQFARFQLIPYEPEQLPIRLLSYLPYEAEVTSPAAGRLESFRYYTPGWIGEVNGREVPASRSWNGLVTVPIEAGRNRVVLRYRPPALLLAAYWVMLASWAGAVGIALFHGVRSALPRQRIRAENGAAGAA